MIGEIEDIRLRRPRENLRSSASTRSSSTTAEAGRRGGRDWADLRYFGQRRSEIAGVDVHISRTGYTGDLGYEIWVAAGSATEVWDALWEAGEPHGIRPAGIRALDVARVEAGLILIEAEYTSARHAISPEQQYSPFEIGLGALEHLAAFHVCSGSRSLRSRM